MTVIEGQIEVSCGESKEKLSKGDTFRFQSNRDHTLKNISKQKAQVLMINYIDPVNGSFNCLQQISLNKQLVIRWWAF